MRWQEWGGLALAGAGLALLLGSGGVSSPWTALGLARAATQTSTGLLLMALGLAGRRGVPLQSALAIGAPRVGWPRIVLWTGGLLGLSLSLDIALRASALLEDSRLGELEAAFRGTPVAQLPLVLLGVALAPAIGEELAFRGLLLGALAARYPWPWAIAVSSLAFGVVHFDLWQGAAATVLGLYLACMTLAARSLWPAVIAHAVNNSLGVLAPAWAPEWTARPEALAALGIVLGGCLLGAIADLRRRWPGPESQAQPGDSASA